MPFLLAEILNFQGSTHRIGVGSFSILSKGRIISCRIPPYQAVLMEHWNDGDDFTAGRKNHGL